MNTEQELNLTQEKNYERLRDIVIGTGDGLTIPFALAAGLSNVVESNQVIVTAGIITLAAGSIAMGIGGISAAKSSRKEFHHDLKKKYETLEERDQDEKQEVKSFFNQLGLSEAMQLQATEELSKDKKNWEDFIHKYGSALHQPEKGKATRSGINIALSYIAGGIIPLIPYMLTTNISTAFKISVAVTLICLFVSGWAKSRFTGEQSWSAAFRMMLTGATAAAAAYIVAKIFMG